MQACIHPVPWSEAPQVPLFALSNPRCKPAKLLAGGRLKAQVRPALNHPPAVVRAAQSHRRGAARARRGPVPHLVTVKRAGNGGLGCLRREPHRLPRLPPQNPSSSLPTLPGADTTVGLHRRGSEPPAQGTVPRPRLPEASPEVQPSSRLLRRGESTRGFVPAPGTREGSSRRAELMQRGGKANLELTEPKPLHFHFFGLLRFS